MEIKLGIVLSVAAFVHVSYINGMENSEARILPPTGNTKRKAPDNSTDQTKVLGGTAAKKGEFPFVVRVIKFHCRLKQKIRLYLFQ